MRCNEIQSHIADYLTDTLPESHREEVREHLGSCRECEEEANGLADVWRIGRAIPSEPPDSEAMRARFDEGLASYMRETAPDRAEVEAEVGVEAVSSRKRFPLAASLWPTRPAFQILFVILMAVGLFAAQKTAVLVIQRPVPPAIEHPEPAQNPKSPPPTAIGVEPAPPESQRSTPEPIGRTVRGRILGTPEPGSANGVPMLYLEGAGYSTARVTGDGSFEFRGVLPGTYTLFPSGSLFPSPPQRIEVSDQDLADIAVPTPLRLEVQGKIVSRAGAPVTGDLAMSICSNVLEAAGPRRPPRCESVKAHSVDGGFSVLLPEGSYKFRVGRFNAAANRATSAGEVRSITYGGADVLNQPITVNRAAPAELLITLASTSPPEGAIPGQMYVDGQVPSGFSVQSIKILLIPQAGGSQLEADVNADGSFAFENTDPNARYKVGIKGPAAVYLIAARYGGVNPLSTPIEIKSAGTPLQIQIGFQPGRVEVAIKDGATFVAGAQVRLQPEASYRDDLVRNGTADSQGRVLFAGVPPGNYFIVVEQPKSPNPLGQPGTVGTLIRVERASAAAITIQIHP